MKLLKLQLENFRSYSQHTHIFDPERNVTILVGENGRGKTNFLEAIYLLSLGKSFRVNLHDDMVEWEKPYLRCNAEVSTRDDEAELEVFYSSSPTRRKNFKKNGVNLRHSDYFGSLPTVLFHPEDLNMLYLSPILRRQYMDVLLSQTNREYLQSLSKYKQVLKQRNALLHQIRDARFKGQDVAVLLADLDAWDHEIALYGQIIIAHRSAFIEFLEKELSGIYREISGGKEHTVAIYQSKVLDHYLERLTERRDVDILQAKTTRGPHRDDIIFSIDGKEIGSAASRGEFRTLLLAIKLAEIDYIRKHRKLNPVLLLDDVFSELDPGRQAHLLEAIKDCQTIITTTELPTNCRKQDWDVLLY